MAPVMAQFTATYTFSGGNDVTSLAFNGSNPTGATFGALTKVGITSSSSTGNYRGSNWPTAATADLSKYIQFTVTVQANYMLNLSSLTFGVGRSGTGPTQWQWRSSIGSYVAPISTYSNVSSGLSNSGGTLTNPDANQGWTGNVLNLSGASYQSLAAGTYTFRLYGFNSEASGGTGGLQGNMSIAGTVVPAAPPTPSITVGATSFNGAFGNVTVGQVSGVSSFTVAGSNLGSNNLVVTAPAGFQVRKGAEAYATSTSISPSSGSVATTTINVRFAPLSAGAQSGSVTIASGSTSGTAQPVSGNGVAAAAPEKLAITNVNGGSDVVQGLPFSVVVQAQDVNSVGQNVSSNTGVVISADGPGTLGGTLTGTIAAGTNTVTFAGLTYDQAHAGVVFTISRTSGDVLANGTSVPVPVLGAAESLAFVNVPASGNVGSPLTTFAVQVRRSGGQVATEFSGTINLSVASGPGSISGGSAIAVNGVASFTNVILSTSGSYTLAASATGLNPATSTVINILSAPTSIYSNAVDDVPGVGQPNLQDPYVFGNVNDPNLIVTGMGRGSGITGTGAGSRFNANGWNVGSLTTDKYFYWKFAPQAGYTIDLFSLTGNWQSSSSGATAYALRSSVNGYSTNIASGTIPNTGSQSSMNISLGAAILDAITSDVEFRLYAWGASGATGTFSINDFTFTGNVIPPPAATATFTQVTTGIASSPLEGGTTNHRLFGFSVVSDATVSTLPFEQMLTGLALTSSASPIGTLTNARLVDGSNALVGTFALTENGLELTGISLPLGAVATYFIVADVVSTVTAGTPAITLSLGLNGIALSGGLKLLLPAAPASSGTYTFTPSTLPVLSAQPESLQFEETCVGENEEVNVRIIGANLVGNVVLGPLEGFLFLDPEDIFGSYEESLTLPSVGGAVDREVIVRFEPGAGVYTTPIPVTNAAVSIAIVVSGEGVDTPPTVATGVASAAGATDVVLAGSVAADGEGCSALIAAGIEYSTTPGFAPGTGTQVAGLVGANWSVTITGLDACTTYHYRAYATNNGGTAYGTEATFSTTPPTAPVATTATGINATGFTANWQEVPGATGYVLEVSTLPGFAVETYGADLFISEYIEGSGNNKYVEVYNPTGSTVNLSNYSLRIHANGQTAGSIAVLPSGTLAPGAAAVYRHTGASITSYPVLSTVNWNGDDAFQLLKGGVAIDMFGPAPTGSSPGNFAMDVTLVRKANITQGTSTWTIPTAAQWTTFATDNTTNLGVHTCDAPRVDPSFVGVYNALSVGNVTSYPVTGLTEGVTYYYRVRAVIGAGCESGNSAAISAVPVAEPFTLQILHASDFESPVSAITSAPNFAAIVDRLEETHPNTLKLSSGDNFLPSPVMFSGEDPTLVAPLKAAYENYYGGPFANNDLRAGIGRVDISILNILGVEASALGNHEFDLGTNELRNIIAGVNSGTAIRWFGAQFPYLSSNLDFSGDANMANLFTATREAPSFFQSDPSMTAAAIAATKKLAPSTIIDVNGERIGVVGVTTPLVQSLSSTGATTIIGPNTDDMAALAAIVQPVIDDLRNLEGINKIILLSHLQQISNEKALAGLVRGVDVIIAGGSNTLMADGTDRLHNGDVAAEAYPFLTTDLDGAPVAIINTDGEYKYVGRLVVEFDDNGNIIPASIDPAISGAYPTDDLGVEEVWGEDEAFTPGSKGQEVRDLMNAVEAVIIAKDGDIYGRTDVYLEGRRNFVRTEETNLGDLSADANLWIARQYDATVAVSIKNGGGIRSSIGSVVAVGGDVVYGPPAANPIAGKAVGDISRLDIENSLRFNNLLTTLDVTAAGLRQTLEHGVAASGPGQTQGRFPQISGVRFSYDETLAPGARVLNAIIVDENNATLDTLVHNGTLHGAPDRVFRVVTLNFLSTGGDGYPFNTLGTNLVDLPTLPDAGPQQAAFATAGSEQDAFAEYIKFFHGTNAYASAETPASADERIQEVNQRADCILPTLYYADVDQDGYGDPNSFITNCPGTAPEGYVTNNTDDCPELAGRVGDACDDLNPATFNDVITADCQCAGTPIVTCTENVTVDLRTDLNSAQVSWQILAQNSGEVLCQFTVPVNGITTPITENCCLPQGCYRLRVLDSGGDGFVTGGYQLRESGVDGRRIIDNTNNFNTGSSSALMSTYENGAFCVPVGDDKVLFSSCDKLDWVDNKFIVAHANAAVTAQYGVTNTTSGYEFWFFDPNGSYSFRRFRSHATSDGYGSGATRACHFKVNGWTNSIATPRIPANTLLNVRVRGRVAGSNLPFGAACLFKIDAALAACPRVKLQDDPNNTSDFSCGVFRNFGGGSNPANRIYANPPQPIPAVASSNVRYQFRFRIAGEGICIVRPPQTSAQMTLNWSATSGAPLICNKTYEVDVRVSLNGGATWCFGPAGNGQAAACADTEDWGKVCNVTINPCTQQGGGNNSMATMSNNTFTMYPNPNRGDQLFLSVSSVEEGVQTVSVDIFDLTGKRVMAQTIAVQDGFVNTNMQLNGDLAGGLYLVNITAGSKVFTERLVLQQ